MNTKICKGCRKEIADKDWLQWSVSVIGEKPENYMALTLRFYTHNKKSCIKEFGKRLQGDQ